MSYQRQLRDRPIRIHSCQLLTLLLIVFVGTDFIPGLSCQGYKFLENELIGYLNKSSIFTATVSYTSFQTNNKVKPGF